MKWEIWSFRTSSGLPMVMGREVRSTSSSLFLYSSPVHMGLVSKTEDWRGNEPVSLRQGMVGGRPEGTHLAHRAGEGTQSFGGPRKARIKHDVRKCSAGSKSAREMDCRMAEGEIRRCDREPHLQPVQGAQFELLQGYFCRRGAGNGTRVSHSVSTEHQEGINIMIAAKTT